MTPRRIRLAVALGVSLLFLAALMNLLLVAEPAPAVDPTSRPPRSWSTGTDAAAIEGRETWAFQFAPEGRRIVEADIVLPYTVRIVHIAGRATLENTFTFWVDGDRVREVEEDVVQEPRGNGTERVRRTTNVAGSWSTSDEPVRMKAPKDAERVVLLLTWDWRFVPEPGAAVTFEVQAGEARVAALDTGGLPGCGADCGRTLAVLTFAGQLAAWVWYARAPDAKPPKPAFRPSPGEIEVEIEPDEDRPSGWRRFKA